MIKTLAYAGLGLAQEANDKMKDRFDQLVEEGKKVDSEGKNYVGDFFKTIDSTKDDFEASWDKNKEKIEDMFPFLKELEARFKKEEETEEAQVVEETK